MELDFWTTSSSVAVVVGALVAISSLVLTRNTKRVEILADLARNPPASHPATQPLLQAMLLEAFRLAYYPTSAVLMVLTTFAVVTALTGGYLMAMGVLLLTSSLALATFLFVLGALYFGGGLWLASMAVNRKKNRRDEIRDWLRDQERKLHEKHVQLRSLELETAEAKATSNDAPAEGER